MNEYRVVCGDGALYWDFESEAEARRKAREWDAVFSIHPPHRVQRMVWEDVPEPEPLPDLPEKVRVWTKDGRAFIMPPIGSAGWRRFDGTVTEWQEVTE